VVGKVTKSKLLGQIGMGLGIAGAVLGLGAVAGGMGMFGETVKSGLAQGASSLSAAPGATSALSAPVGTVGASNQANLAANSLGTVGAQPGAISTGLSLPGHGAGSLPSQLQVPGLIQTAPNAGAFGGPGIGVSAPTQAFAPTTAMPSLQSPSIQPPGTTLGSQPGSSGTGLEQGLGTGANRTSDTWLQGVLKSLKDAPTEVAKKGIWDGLDSNTKAMLMNTAGQGAAGTVGGIFSSIQADRQSELLEQINRENRQYQRWQSEQAPGMIQF
jgi:hypothetical protein